MKKLSVRHRNHLIRKSRQALRPTNGKRARRDRNIKEIKVTRKRRDQLPAPVISRTKYKRYVSFDAPSNFDIFDNYQETLAFLLDVRRFFSRRPGARQGRNKPYIADFSTIKNLDPASGLLLAAEIDRWSRTTRRKPISVDYLWPRFLRNYFEEAGLFQLLGIAPQTEPDDGDATPGLKTIAYRSDVLTKGEIADKFRREIEKVVGEAIGPSRKVYDALSEAMDNVVGHAYPPEDGHWHADIKRRWWLGGSWSECEHEVTVQIYDQGVGIPATLPRSTHWSNMLPILKSLDPERSDASLIEAAMQYRRTSTGDSGRGKGMAQMAHWIEKTSQGSLRILSGCGSLTYLPGRRPIKRVLPVDFGGTLVEWKVPL